MSAALNWIDPGEELFETPRACWPSEIESHFESDWEGLCLETHAVTKRIVRLGGPPFGIVDALPEV